MCFHCLQLKKVSSSRFLIALLLAQYIFFLSFLSLGMNVERGLIYVPGGKGGQGGCYFMIMKRVVP